MALNDTIKRLISNAYTNTLAPAGLTEKVTFKYYVSDGEFDVETDTISPVWRDVSEVDVIVAKPSFDDVKDHKVVFSDAKLIIPGPFLPSEPETDTDKVLRANGELWDIRKVVGVPGSSVWIVYIYRT